MKTSKKLLSGGNIIIPKDMRLKLGWKSGMSLDISIGNDGTLIIKKHQETCYFCGTAQNICHYKNLYMCWGCADKMKGALS